MREVEKLVMHPGYVRIDVTQRTQQTSCDAMLSPKRQPFVFAVAVTQLLLVGWLDYVTSFEISVTVLYYIPIAYAAWNLGRGWSFGFGALCAGTIVGVAYASGQQYSSDWILAEQALMQALGFGFVAFSFNYFKRTLRLEREKVRRLEGILTICTGCQKLRDEQGNWTDLASFLREGGAAESQAILCPTCAREVYAKSG